MNADEIFMQRAFALASLGLGKTRPNPCVGCIVVVDGKIIGEGWHQAYGGPHAEVNAVASVEDKNLLSHATIYVNLEPCSHFGKTPPCADMLVRHKVKKVIISNVDTNPLVGGSGIQKLREAGIEVVTNVLELEGRELNKRFFTFIEKQRPWIVLKWAETADHFIARADYSSQWISNAYSRQLVHRWRSEEAAVMVGTSTAAYDNPALSVREWAGTNPTRIVIDRFSRLKQDLGIFDGTQPTICYTLNHKEDRPGLSFVRLDEHNFFEQMLADLFKRKIQSVMIEGGQQTLSWFIKAGCWDEARIFSSRQSFGDGIEAPLLRGELRSRENIFSDTLEIFTPHRGAKD